jgi:hypothetical protein
MEAKELQLLSDLSKAGLTVRRINRGEQETVITVKKEGRDRKVQK